MPGAEIGKVNDTIRASDNLCHRVSLIFRIQQTTEVCVAQSVSSVRIIADAAVNVLCVSQPFERPYMGTCCWRVPAARHQNSSRLWTMSTFLLSFLQGEFCLLGGGGSRRLSPSLVTPSEGRPPSSLPSGGLRIWPASPRQRSTS